MNYDLSEIFSSEEVYFIKGIIESIKGNSLDKYYFSKDNFSSVISIYKITSDVIDSLISKGILQLNIKEKCVACNNPKSFCFCEESVLVKDEYYLVNIDVFNELTIHTLEYSYNIKHTKILQVRDEKVLTFEGNNHNASIHMFYNRLSKEFYSTLPSKEHIFISVMPLNDSDNELNLYEWHEILNSDNFDMFSRLMRDIHTNIISKDYYVLDVGDDIENDDVESIRDTFRKFMIQQNFCVFTEVEKYRPELSDYSLQLEKIKEVFIKDNKKIFVIKPSSKEIYLALYSNGFINIDEDLHRVVKFFDAFIRNRIQKNRSLKKQQQRISYLEKSLVVITTIINVFACISGVITKNPVFKQINDFFKTPIPLYAFIALNIIYALILFFTVVLPKIKISFFKWENGLSKINNKILAKKMSIN